MSKEQEECIHETKYPIAITEGLDWIIYKCDDCDKVLSEISDPIVG